MIFAATNLGEHEGTYPLMVKHGGAAARRYRSPSVMAPRLAVETSFMYLAIAPRV
jgi:hypothetical protein